MERHLFRRLMVGALVAASASCVFDAGLPADALVSCDDGVCPEGLFCLVATRACVTAESACVEIEGTVAQPAPAGNACTLGTGDEGICIAGACVTSRCGDAFVDVRSEACDDGEDNSDTIGGRCRTSCVLPACGDGALDPGESCDDGNTVSGDGCRADCQKTEWCGDAVPDEGEGCDDGDANPANACNACLNTRWTSQPVFGDRGFSMSSAFAIAIDRSGVLFVSTPRHDAVRRVDPEGIITAFAGSGTNGYNGDGISASDAHLSTPVGLAFDSAGNLFIADDQNHRVRRVDALTGVVTTIAGTGESGFFGDNGPATAAELNRPGDVAVAPDGTLYIADHDNYRIRKVSPAGTISTFAGTGPAEGSAGDGGAAAAATLKPSRLAFDPSGGLLVVDEQRVRRIDLSTGQINAFAGTTVAGFSGDGGPATSAQLDDPEQVAVTADGSVLIADSRNHRVRRVDVSTRLISTIAGNGDDSDLGTTAVATETPFPNPTGLAVAPNGEIVVADGSLGVLRLIDPATAAVRLLADAVVSNVPGDGGFATAASLRTPSALDVDGATLYVADRYNSAVRRVNLDTGAIDTLIGTGIYGVSGEGGPAALAQVGEVDGLVVADDGAVFLSDTYESRVLRIDPQDGTVSRYAGNGSIGPAGDEGPAMAAVLNEPRGLALGADGSLYVVESGAHRVRRIDAAGTIHAFAGTGLAGYEGDEGPAVEARLNGPYGIDVGPNGSVYIADNGNRRVRVVSPAGIISTFAGNGALPAAGDGPAATSAGLAGVNDVAVGAAGDVLIAERNGARIRVVRDGLIEMLVGDGVARLSGDGGPALQASIDRPFGVALSSDGTVFIADAGNQRVRRVKNGIITSVVGTVHPGTGPFALARASDAQALALVDGHLFIAGGVTGVVTRADLAEEVLTPVAGAVGGVTLQPGLAVDARELRALVDAAGLAWDEAERDMFVSERGHNLIWRIDLSGPAPTASVLAGNESGRSYEDGPIATATFAGPAGLAFDDVTRTLYVADTDNHVVRAIDLVANTVSTVAGVPTARGYFGELVDPLDALLSSPEGVALSTGGDVFIADTGNHRVRRIDAESGLIETVLGDGTASSGGTGTPARDFPVFAPRGLAFDSYGNLFVSSTTSLRMVTSDANGAIDGSGEVYTVYGAPPRASYPESVTRCLTGLAIDEDDSIYAADACAGIVVRIERLAEMTGER